MMGCPIGGKAVAVKRGAGAFMRFSKWDEWLTLARFFGGKRCDALGHFLQNLWVKAFHPLAMA